MADLTIRLKTAVDPSGAEQEINKLIEKLNGKNIDLKFNQSKVKTQLNELIDHYYQKLQNQISSVLMKLLYIDF